MGESASNLRRQLLTEVEAAALLGLKRNTLAIWRCTGRYNLPFVKVGRLVRYDLDELHAWLDKRRAGAEAWAP